MDNSDDMSVDEDPAPMNQNKEKDKEKNGKIYNKEIDTIFNDSDNIKI